VTFVHDGTVPRSGMQDWATPVVVVAVDLEVASPVLFVLVVGTRQGAAVAELRTVDEELESLGWNPCQVDQR